MGPDNREQPLSQAEVHAKVFTDWLPMCKEMNQPISMDVKRNGATVTVLLEADDQKHIESAAKDISHFVGVLKGDVKETIPPRIFIRLSPKWTSLLTCTF
jgi:hypothetical protein